MPKISQQQIKEQQILDEVNRLGTPRLDMREVQTIMDSNEEVVKCIKSLSELNSVLQPRRSWNVILYFIFCLAAQFVHKPHFPFSRSCPPLLFLSLQLRLHNHEPNYSRNFNTPRAPNNCSGIAAAHRPQHFWVQRINNSFLRQQRCPRCRQGSANDLSTSLFSRNLRKYQSNLILSENSRIERA